MVCGTKWCVKDGVLKMVCVTKSKLCVKNGVLRDVLWKMVWWIDGVWHSGMWHYDVWKMVCWKMVCGRWCVKDGVSKMVCYRRFCVIEGVWIDGVWQSGVWKMVYVTKLCVKDGMSKMVGDKVEWGACHAKWVWMWDCATPATWYQGEWDQVPRDIKVNVTKCHTCHMKRRWISPSATPATQSGAAPLATNPDQARHTVPLVLRLPRNTTVDVSLCHACHVKRRWMSASATPATQSGAAPQATNPDHARNTVPWVPRLPRKTMMDVSLCHAYHVISRWMSPSATPATWNDGGCDQVPRLPRKVARRPRRHIFTKRATQHHECHACHTKRRWMWVCATPATWNEGGCHQVPRVPRLPRKVARRPRRQIRTKCAIQYHECHACHAKRRHMWVCVCVCM